MGALSVPTVGLFGSTEIGAGAVALGVLTAPVSWPYILAGAVIGSLVGYGIPKSMEVHKKRKFRKKLKERMIKRKNRYSMEMMEEVVDVMKEIEDIVKDDDIDKSDLEEVSIALNDIFRVLDKYFYRDMDEIKKGLDSEHEMREEIDKVMNEKERVDKEVHGDEERQGLVVQDDMKEEEEPATENKG